MPGRPALVEVSLLVDPGDPGLQSLSGPLPSPLYCPAAHPAGAQATGRLALGHRGRAVPGHPGQQLKHGVQHVAVTLFQLEQPEQGKEAGSLTDQGAAALTQDLGARQACPRRDAGPVSASSSGEGRAAWPLTLAHSAARELSVGKASLGTARQPRERGHGSPHRGAARSTAAHRLRKGSGVGDRS